MVREKITNKLPELHEFGKFRGLTEIPVGAESLHFLAIAPRIRGCHDQDKRIFTAGAGAQLAQYVSALVAGHIDVKQDEIWTRRLGIGIRLLEKLHGLLAIVCDVNLGFDAGFLKRLADQEDVRLAVLGNQNLPGPR